MVPLNARPRKLGVEQIALAARPRYFKVPGTESIAQPFDSKSPTVFAEKGEAILALDATDVLDGLA